MQTLYLQNQLTSEYFIDDKNKQDLFKIVFKLHNAQDLDKNWQGILKIFRKNIIDKNKLFQLFDKYIQHIQYQDEQEFVFYIFALRNLRHNINKHLPAEEKIDKELYEKFEFFYVFSVIQKQEIDFIQKFYIDSYLKEVKIKDIEKYIDNSIFTDFEQLIKYFCENKIVQKKFLLFLIYQKYKLTGGKINDEVIQKIESEFLSIENYSFFKDKNFVFLFEIIKKMNIQQLEKSYTNSVNNIIYIINQKSINIHSEIILLSIIYKTAQCMQEKDKSLQFWIQKINAMKKCIEQKKQIFNQIVTCDLYFNIFQFIVQVVDNEQFKDASTIHQELLKLLSDDFKQNLIQNNKQTQLTSKNKNVRNIDIDKNINLNEMEIVYALQSQNQKRMSQALNSLIQTLMNCDYILGVFTKDYIINLLNIDQKFQLQKNILFMQLFVNNPVYYMQIVKEFLKDKQLDQKNIYQIFQAIKSIILIVQNPKIQKQNESQYCFDENTIQKYRDKLLKTFLQYFEEYYDFFENQELDIEFDQILIESYLKLLSCFVILICKIKRELKFFIKNQFLNSYNNKQKYVTLRVQSIQRTIVPCNLQNIILFLKNLN